ncbi:ABC transporter permease subunit [Hamadaea tsunoensis]|uniref:ABC transporter permease subunit n=1 Tax=Hamadaea tsunoensis TaxID=53368 RepID=UPI0003FCD320|nr:ABC transporter permease subunit [Hamadaea tsunoensis]
MSTDVLEQAAPPVATPPAEPAGSLVRAELRRLLSRRFVQILTAVMIGAFAVTVGVTMAGSRTPTAADWSSATEQAQQVNAANKQAYDECTAAHAPDASSTQRLRYPDKCVYVEAAPEDFLYDTYVFRTSIKGLVGFLAAYLALFGFLVGATFIGAEMSSGGLTNLLLWRPQRMTVLGTKLGVLLLAVGAFSVLFSAVYIGTFYGIASATGYVGTVSSELVQDIALMAGRGIGLALIVTALSFGVATIGRHTAAALGLLTAYGVVWEGGLRIIMEVVRANLPDPWFLSTYVGAWMTGSFEFYSRDPSGCYYSDGSGDASYCSPDHYTVYWWHAAAVFLALLVIVVGGAFAHFRKRDLT